MNKIGFNINDLHKVQYEILVEFDRVCKKYGLTYFLCYGTLLGAIRHNGFIPWDDDIDTLMPYEDFEKLKRIDPKEWRNPYFLQHYSSDKEYKRCFAKLRNSNTTLITKELEHLDINHGVDIDIYPLIHLANNPNLRKKQYRNTMIYMLLRYDEPPRNHGKIYYYAGKAILTIIPNHVKKALVSRFEKKITAYQKNKCKESYVVLGNVEIMKTTLKTSWFRKAILHKFEDGLFPVPIGYHEFLISRFGKNYMLPPPENKRGIKLGTFVKLDLNNPYTKYKGLYYCQNSKRTEKIKDNRWVSDTETVDKR